jgi:DNA topoisomerase-3
MTLGAPQNPSPQAKAPTVISHRVGDVVGAVSARLEAKRTTAPERYTQDSLLDDMVNAHKFAASDVERQILRTTEGLGTSRTRVPMIEGLIRRGLLRTARVGKRWQIMTSPEARELLRDVPQEMRNVAMTARWEVALAGVREGRFKADELVAGGYKFVDRMIDQLRRLKQERAPVVGR